MPTLLIDFGTDRAAGTFTGPLLIGRRDANALVINEPQMELVHAWISSTADQYFIANIARLGQTIINGKPISSRHNLQDGDIIEFGSEIRITFYSDTLLPPYHRQIELLWRGPIVDDVDVPVELTCSCGEAVSIAPIFRGTMTRCPKCSNVLDIPVGATLVLPSVPAPTTQRDVGATLVLPSVPALTTQGETSLAPTNTEQKCGVCHTPVTETESHTSCPSCGVHFHPDCWTGNWGCSSYGCPQVNSARPKEAFETIKITADETDNSFPWEFMLLGGSVASLILGALAFGLPSLFVACLSIGMRRHSDRQPLVVASGALAVVGLVIGMEVSRFWWLGQTP